MIDDPIALADWRRRVAEMYASIRALPAREGWELWRQTRDELFRSHPQSPLPADVRASFDGLRYYDYDGAWRVHARVVPTAHERYEIATSDDSPMAFVRFARVELDLANSATALELYWLDSYGGGIFVPFRDATSGDTTYGAGRYLWDSAKGADLGTDGERIIVDFNFAYNPSCSYDARWVCPLAPPPNRLDVAIAAGERTA